MYAFITAFQQYAPLNGLSATSLTDFTTWFNGLRNNLVKYDPNGNAMADSIQNQLALDLLSNAAYAVAKGKTDSDINKAVRSLNSLNYSVVSQATPISVPTTTINVSGSSLPSATFVQSMLDDIDMSVDNNSTIDRSQVNTLETLT